MARAANIALAALILALLAVASTVTAIPMLTGTKAVNITAGSMTGTFDFGTIVLADADVEPTVGSVIVYKVGQRTPVTHRLVRIQPDPSGNDVEFITRGDFNETDDPEPVAPGSVVGVVTGSIPYAGLATGLLGQLPIQLFLGTLAVGLYLLSNQKPKPTRESANALAA